MTHREFSSLDRDKQEKQLLSEISANISIIATEKTPELRIDTGQEADYPEG